jgi:hypothetical protein
MLRKLGGRALACSMLVTGFLLVEPETASGQAEGQLSEKPIAIFYAKDITEKRIAAYAIRLSERMDFAASFRRELADEVNDSESEPAGDLSIDGLAVYLVFGAVPSTESVSFSRIVDSAAARRKIEADLGDSLNRGGTLIEKDNDCFIVERTYRTERHLEEGEDEREVAGVRESITSEGVIGASYELTTNIEEKNGRKLVVQTTTSRSFHRVYDHFLFEGESERLFTMTLPSAADISAGLKETSDLGFTVHLDRIPPAVRQLGWTMLASGIGSQIQQYDGESDTRYNMRRGSGDLVLAIANAAFFDIDFADGSLTFATEDVPSVQGDLRIRARNNSGLSGKLERARGRSRFAPILSDNASVTCHTCIRFPEESAKALLATSDWLQEAFAAGLPGNPEMISVGDTLSETLKGMAEHRNLELLFKVGWTEESDGVVYGGIQLHDNPQLLPKIFHFMVHVASQLMAHPQAAAGGGDQMMEMIRDGDLELIRIILPDDAVNGITESWGAHITHLYLAHQNSCLWFSMGGENAMEIIRLSVARCDESQASRNPFVSARIDMERWLAYPQNDPVGIAQMPFWLDSNAWWFPPNPLLVWEGYEGEMDRKPQSIMQRAFDAGGSQQFSLTLDADQSGLLLQLSLGEALANHLLARIIDIQDDPQSSEPP